MIFLAVTLGLMAGNIREHIGDRSREKEYIENIRKDLVLDTANLNLWIAAMQVAINPPNEK